MTTRLDTLRYHAGRLGRAGMLGSILLLVALLFLATVVRPKQAALDALAWHNQQARQLALAEQESAARQRNAGTNPDSLAPKAAGVLRRLHDAATQSGLELEQGEYRLVDASDAQFRYYQFSLPVYGSYKEVREFLSSALNSVPALALSSVQMRRESIGETELEVALNFTLYLEASP